jgi:hypothetical protein
MVLQLRKTMKLALVGSALMTGALVAAAANVPAASQHVGVAAARNRTPSIAASGRLVALAWGATSAQGPTDVYLAVSRDGGHTFGSPVQVSDATSRATLSGEQPPRVVFVARRGLEPAIDVVWTSKGTAGTRLLAARSDDGGRTFEPAVVVPGTDAPGNRGWEDVATAHDGDVVAVWLDHRDAASAAGHTGHMMHQPGAHAGSPATEVERAQLSTLYFGRLDAPGARPIAAGVCYCCKTALTTGRDGALYAAWRNVYPGNIRDIAFAMSRDDGRTFGEPLRVSEDQWQLDGCPENGPAIAVDATSKIHVVWPTLTKASGGETLSLFYASSGDGRTFSPRVRIPTTGPAYHAQLALSGSGTLTVAWDEAVKGGRRVRFARATPSAGGGISFSPLSVPGDSAGSYPSIAAVPDVILAAWTQPDSAASQIAIALVR